MVPTGSMYGIFAYIYHENQPNVGKFTIHGSYGVYNLVSRWPRPLFFMVGKGAHGISW